MAATACRRCLRPLPHPRPAIRISPAVPLSRPSSSSSTPPPPSSLDTPHKSVFGLDKPQKKPRQRGPATPAHRPSSLTPVAIRNRLVDSLAAGRPREALRLYCDTLDAPHAKARSGTAAGLAWLFLQYQRPRTAFQAVEALKSKGYAVPPALSAKLLHHLSDELVTEQDRLVTVLAWFSEAVLEEKAMGKRADERILDTVFRVLLKIGRSDWLAEVFRLYRDTLRPGEAGSANLWALAISGRAHDGDVQGARALFDTWRAAALQASPSSAPLPSDPYLALLNYYADHSPPLPASRDPAYAFLAEIQQDSLAPSSALLNALLRVELRRNRFSSFWGLWAQFEPLGVERSSLSWSFAHQALVQNETLRKKRGRLHNSPLLASSPIPYSELRTPSARILFRTLLSDRLVRTNCRPVIRLPTTAHDTLSPYLLNSFLDLFILRRQDYLAAAVVLETFAVHRLEPDARTHGSVVVGVVRNWERGRLGSRLADEEQQAALEAVARDPYGLGEADRRTQRRSDVLGGPESLAMIRTILEGRKHRVALWTAPPSPPSEDVEGVEEGEDGAELDPLLNPLLPLPEERLNELRDTGYLVALLRRCTGLDEEEWARAMVETRREMLPEGKARRVGEEGDEGLEGEELNEATRKRRKWWQRTHGVASRKEE
ncbi:hypothetical protein JCM8097_006093 [Rhodosporidiobolus ruineniae]